LPGARRQAAEKLNSPKRARRGNERRDHGPESKHPHGEPPSEEAMSLAISAAILASGVNPDDPIITPTRADGAHQVMGRSSLNRERYRIAMNIDGNEGRV
jgi:hypothetical protein